MAGSPSSSTPSSSAQEQRQYSYDFVPSEWRLSTFPRDLIPSTLPEAPALHVFPPVVPTFYELLKGDAARRVQGSAAPPPLRRSPRGHGNWPTSGHPGSSPLGVSNTRGPTATTHELLKQLGHVRFQAAPGTVQRLVQSTLPNFYKDLSQLEHARAEIALAVWHTNLRTQEATLWRPLQPPVRNPPPYSMRSTSQTASGYAEIRLTEALPQNEVEVTVGILAPSLNRFIEDLFRQTNYEVLSYLVGPAPESGSGTSDIGLRRPRAFDQGKWDNVEKFVLQVKLLAPEDWKALLHCIRDEAEGFKLVLTDDGDIGIDCDLPPVWGPVLAQTVEQLHTNRAKFLIMTDYERFVLFTLDAPTSISISQLLYRDKANVPLSDSSVDPQCLDRDTAPMELILSLVLRAKPATDPGSLWADVTAVRQAVRTKRRLTADKYDNIDSQTRKRQNVNSGPSTAASHSAENMTMTISFEGQVFAEGDRPNYLKLPPAGLVSAQLEISGGEPELVRMITDLGHENHPADSAVDSDDQPSLTWSSTPELSSKDSTIEIRLGEFLGRGRTWDVFAATLAARLPGGAVSHAPAAVKHVELTSLESAEEAHAGYPALGRVLRAVDREASILRALHRAVPGIAPQPYTLWTGTANDHVLLATEDCGDHIATKAADADETTKHAVANAYSRVHAAGFVHGDVHWRHVLRDRHGDVRLVDWEGARDVRADSDGGREAIEEEMAAVYNMLGLSM